MLDIERDRRSLVSAAHAFMATERFKRATILPLFSRDDIASIETAILATTIFQDVADKVAFSSAGDVLIDASQLADKLTFSIHLRQEAETSVEWLIRLLTKRTANGLFVAAIWGLDVSSVIPIANGIKLIPFSELPKSHMKSRIDERGAKSPGWFAWWSEREWGAPGAAYVVEMREFSYLEAQSVRQRVDELHRDGRSIWTLLEVLIAKSPLVFGYWFQYDDEEFDLGYLDTFMTLSTPEIPPKIKHHVAAETDAFPLLRRFNGLPLDYQNLLLRAANRFALSKCRQQRVDFVLDLALAYEIAVSGIADQALSPTWKVSTRTAQMIGGDLAVRLEKRNTVRKFYQLRNEAAHGGSLSKPASIAVMDEAAKIFPDLLAKLISHDQPPNWAAIEIEALEP